MQWATDERTPEKENESAAEISAAASWKRRSLTPITGAKNIADYLGQIPPGAPGGCSDNGASAPGGACTPGQTDAPGAIISLPCRTPDSRYQTPQARAQTSCNGYTTRNRFEGGDGDADSQYRERVRALVVGAGDLVLCRTRPLCLWSLCSGYVHVGVCCGGCGHGWGAGVVAL